MSYTIPLIKFVAFLDLLAVGLIVPLIPSHVRQLGASHIYVGILGSVYSGFQLGSGPLIGSLSDLKGCRSILIYTLVICGAAYFCMGFTTSVAVIIVLRAVLGLFKQTQLLTKALVPEYEKNEKQQSAIFGKMAAISGMGMTLGPIIGGHMAEDFPEKGFLYISIIVAMCFILNAGCVFLLPQAIIKKKSKADEKKQSDQNVFQKIYNNSKESALELSKVDWSQYWEVFIFKALLGNAVGRLVTLEMILRKSDREHKGTLIGASNSVASLSGVMSPMAAGLIGQYLGVKYVIYASLCSNVLALILSYRYKSRHVKVD
ncbi:unnamed protein product [Leptosia nina]|uniref:Major facilitator superfamily (MFS) profile domain-containing protein n=1 Tax=Leptosia nina TaxID=320188 RepID=A0AAV1JAD9_9NEOP